MSALNQLDQHTFDDTAPGNSERVLGWVFLAIFAAGSEFASDWVWLLGAAGTVAIWIVWPLARRRRTGIHAWRWTRTFGQPRSARISARVTAAMALVAAAGLLVFVVGAAMKFEYPSSLALVVAGIPYLLLDLYKHRR